MHVMPLLKADASSSDSRCDSPGKQQFLSPANACLQTILIIILSYCLSAGERIMFKCPNSYDRDFNLIFSFHCALALILNYDYRISE